MTADAMLPDTATAATAIEEIVAVITAVTITVTITAAIVTVAIIVAMDSGLGIDSIGSTNTAAQTAGATAIATGHRTAGTTTATLSVQTSLPRPTAWCYAAIPRRPFPHRHIPRLHPFHSIDGTQSSVLTANVAVIVAVTVAVTRPRTEHIGYRAVVHRPNTTPKPPLHHLNDQTALFRPI